MKPDAVICPHCRMQVPQIARAPSVQEKYVGRSHSNRNAAIILIVFMGAVLASKLLMSRIDSKPQATVTTPQRSPETTIAVGDIVQTKNVSVLFDDGKGGALQVPSRTPVRILHLDSTGGGRSVGHYKVLILDGRFAGRTGKVAASDIE